MTFSWDLNVAALTALIVLIIAVIGHIVAVTVYMVKTNGKANAALRLAEAMEERLRKVEQEHVLAMALRVDFREFQSSISEQFISLRSERRDDMRGLHDRLNEILVRPPGNNVGRK